MIRRIFSTDHKTIGVQYAITSLLFLILGFAMALLMRWQLAFPGRPVPWIGGLFAETQAVGGILLPEFYNQLVAMHGTVMVFLGVVTLAVGAFGNYFMPLQIGAREMAFPRLNMLSYWTYLASGLLMAAGFFLPGGAAQSGWTSYPPMASLMPAGQTLWLLGIIGIGASSLLGAVNFIVTAVHMRAPGVTPFRMPFFVWSQLVSSFLLLLAFPALQIAAVLQLMDRLAGTSFFMPSGLVVSGTPVAAAGGGNPLLWQHLFWFLAHPEVYVLILPAFGIVAEVIAVNAQRPLQGYRSMVGAALFMGLMSVLVWAHHMFLTDMGTAVSAFFQFTTMVISIPSIVILTSLVLSLWGGSIRFTTPMLFAIAFLPMFGLGGLTGLPLGIAASDIHLHDTMYVVAHFHYLVAPGTLFALFAGIYHWFPQVTGRKMSESLGKIHFYASFLFMNGVFFPLFIQGMAGVNRRLWDPTQYAHAQALQPTNVFSSACALGLALAQIPFIYNFFVSAFRGEKTVPQAPLPAAEAGNSAPHPVTRLTNTGLGMIVFLASEAMLFGSLFSAYLLLRTGAERWAGELNWVPAAINTLILLGAGGSCWAARRARLQGEEGRCRKALFLGAVLSLAFLAVKAHDYAGLLGAGHAPSTHLFYAVYFVLTGFHAFHVAAGGAAMLILSAQKMNPQDRRAAARTNGLALYWLFVEIVWVVILCALFL